MSSAADYTRSRERQTSSKWDNSELKSIKVAIMRKNIKEPNTSGPFLRSLDDPAILKTHFRSDEGARPIFDRSDIIVNKYLLEERKIATGKSHTRPSSSRSSSSSERDERKSSRRREMSKDYKRKEYSEKYNRRSGSISRKSVYKTSSPPPRRRSISPSSYRSPDRSRRREKSPLVVSSSHSRRTPTRYSSRRSSRSPPPKSDRATRSRRSRSPGSSRRRSRSYSPQRRHSRRSRSPRHRYYERRSRSPRRRYTPERRLYDPTQYFESGDYWIPNPMLQPRFIPRHMMAPGAFPFPFRPTIAGMVPPRAPLRPRIIYNHRQVGARPAITSLGETAVGTSEEVKESGSEAQQELIIAECETQQRNNDEDDKQDAQQS